MLYGIGNLGVCSTDLDANSAIRQFNTFQNLCISSFSLTSSVNEVLARCFRNGRLQIEASNINQEDYQLDISIEAGDWSSLQFGYGELSTSAPIRLPQNVGYTVPATGGLLITNTDISTANANEASVRVFDATNQIYLEPAAASPAGANEFFVDGTANTIELNASQQGAQLYYTYEKVYTSADQIGAGGQLVREFSFSGTLSSTLYGVEGIGIYIPKAQPISTASIDLSGDRATIDVSFRPVLTGSDTRPFRLIRLDTATAA